MVTATGIILGFVLNFANTWVKTSTAPEGVEIAIGILVLIGVVCLIAVLPRMLRMHGTSATAEQAARYFNRTLALFVTGVSAAVSGALLDMLSNFFG